MFLGDVPRRRIGLVVDHPQRDLDGLCLVAQLLAERGHESVLLPFYTQHFDLPNIPLDAIVLNYVRPANLALIRAAAARGIALVVLDTEGGLIPEDGPTSADGIAAFLRESRLDRQLALYLFWGKHLRDHVVANSALCPERAFVTGCPRFDLAHGGNRPAGDASGHVLVNTNFPIVNPAHVKGSRKDDAALASVGFSPEDIADLVRIVGEVKERMVGAIKALAAARPERTFVVRPHPFESLDPYRRDFATHPNVTVARDGTAIEALQRASTLLHVNCTTAIEACLCGVAPVSLDLVNDPALEKMARLPTQVSHRAADLDQALALIDSPPGLPANTARDLVEPFFGPLDGGAAARVADLLATAPLPSSCGDERQPVRRRMAAAVGASIGSHTIETVRRSLAPARGAKRFRAEDVRKRLAVMAGASGQIPARVEPIRSGLGLPVEALRLSPAPAEQSVSIHDVEHLDTPSKDMTHA